MKYEITIKTTVDFGIEEEMKFECNTKETMYKIIEENFMEGDEVTIKMI